MAFIREVKRGKKGYYYLVESYRESGKVKQRALQYLGTKCPRGPWKGEYVSITVEDALRKRARPTKTTSDYVREADKLAVKLGARLDQFNQLDTLPLEEVGDLRIALSFLEDVIKEFMSSTEPLGCGKDSNTGKKSK